jgi:transposase
MFETTQRQLLDRLQKEPLLIKRLEVLRSIDGVGEATALSWALETCDPQRFPSIADAVSYCGLTSALVSSANKQQRGPISKQRKCAFANRADRGSEAGAAGGTSRWRNCTNEN